MSFETVELVKHFFRHTSYESNTNIEIQQYDAIFQNHGGCQLHEQPVVQFQPHQGRQVVQRWIIAIGKAFDRIKEVMGLVVCGYIIARPMLEEAMARS